MVVAPVDADARHPVRRAALGDPAIWAIGIIMAIGLLNWFGPRHAGTLATAISLATLATLIVLMAAAFPAARGWAGRPRSRRREA